MCIAQTAARMKENRKSSSSAEQHTTVTTTTPEGVIKVDDGADDVDFELYAATGEIKTWDSCAPHTFLRWLGTDIVRVLPLENDKKNDFTYAPIDYSKRSGDPSKFCGFEVNLHAATIAASSPETLKKCYDRMTQKQPSSKL